MIEANILILNGETIEEVEKKYYEKELDDAHASDEEVQKKYEQLVKN